MYMKEEEIEGANFQRVLILIEKNRRHLRDGPNRILRPLRRGHSDPHRGRHLGSRGRGRLAVEGCAFFF